MTTTRRFLAARQGERWPTTFGELPTSDRQRVVTTKGGHDGEHGRVRTLGGRVHPSVQPGRRAASPRQVFRLLLPPGHGGAQIPDRYAPRGGRGGPDRSGAIGPALPVPRQGKRQYLARIRKARTPRDVPRDLGSNFSRGHGARRRSTRSHAEPAVLHPPDGTAPCERCPRVGATPTHLKATTPAGVSEGRHRSWPSSHR